MPCHAWHRYLIDFAKNYSDILDVIVCTLESEPIDWSLRYNWVKNLFPQVNVHHYGEDIPQYPHEHEDFWDLWKNAIKSKVPQKIDYVFASEEYWFKLAEILNAKYIPVNIARDLVQISWTNIRENPLKHWEFLPEEVRSYYLKKVCIFWPESTWKSTLAKNLAKHFKTNSVNEYARDLIDANNWNVEFEDIEIIAKWHIASEKALEKNANRVMFIDTDIIITKIWSNILFKKCPKWIEELSEKPRYSLYLLLDVDVPWVPDVQRYLPNKREWFFDICKQELDKIWANYVVISWNWDERFKKSVNEIEKLLNTDI